MRTQSQGDGLVGEGSCRTSLISECGSRAPIKEEGENWLHKDVLWPTHMCYCTHTGLNPNPDVCFSCEHGTYWAACVPVSVFAWFSLRHQLVWYWSTNPWWAAITMKCCLAQAQLSCPKKFWQSEFILWSLMKPPAHGALKPQPGLPGLGWG